MSDTAKVPRRRGRGTCILQVLGLPEGNRAGGRPWARRKVQASVAIHRRFPSQRESRRSSRALGESSASRLAHPRIGESGTPVLETIMRTMPVWPVLVTASFAPVSTTSWESAPPAAAIVNWDGGGGDFDWNNPLNWDADALPTSADDVDFSASTTCPQSRTSAWVCVRPEYCRRFQERLRARDVESSGIPRRILAEVQSLPRGTQPSRCRHGRRQKSGRAFGVGGISDLPDSYRSLPVPLG